MPSTGIVVQLGQEVSEEFRLRCPEGTAVMFSRYAGTDAMIDEEEFRIMDSREIMCTLEKKEEPEDPS